MIIKKHQGVTDFAKNWPDKGVEAEVSVNKSRNFPGRPYVPALRGAGTREGKED